MCRARVMLTTHPKIQELGSGVTAIVYQAFGKNGDRACRYCSSCLKLLLSCR